MFAQRHFEPRSECPAASAPMRATPDPGIRRNENAGEIAPARCLAGQRAFAGSRLTPLEFPAHPVQPASARLCPGLIAYFGAFSLFALARSPRSQSNLRTIDDNVSPRLTLWVLAFAGCGLGLAGAAAGTTDAGSALAVASPVLLIGPIRTSADCTLLATSCSASCRRCPRVQ